MKYRPTTYINYIVAKLRKDPSNFIHRAIQEELHSYGLPYMLPEEIFNDLKSEMNHHFQRIIHQPPEAGEIEKLVLQAAFEVGYERHFEKTFLGPKKAGLIRNGKPKS